MTEARTDAIAADMQEAVDEARTDERNKADRDRLDRIEEDIRQLRLAQSPPPTAPPAPIEAAPPAAPVDNGMSTVADALEGLKEAVVTKPVEAAETVTDAAAGVIDTTTDTATDVVEEVVPVRKHGLFRSVFGGGNR